MGGSDRRGDSGRSGETQDSEEIYGISTPSCVTITTTVTAIAVCGQAFRFIDSDIWRGWTEASDWSATCKRCDDRPRYFVDGNTQRVDTKEGGWMGLSIDRPGPPPARLTDERRDGWTEGRTRISDGNAHGRLDSRRLRKRRSDVYVHIENTVEIQI